jgi:hypothetical protein
MIDKFRKKFYLSRKLSVSMRTLGTPNVVRQQSETTQIGKHQKRENEKSNNINF